MTSEVPGLFPVGLTDPKKIQPHAEMCDVQNEDDLPTRFWFGDLERGSFRANDQGWSARYSDAELGSYLTFEQEEGRVSVKFAWKSCESMMFCPGKSFGQLARFFVFPAEWEELASELVTEKYNARYFPYQEDSCQICYAPDGPMFTIACPVRIPRLRNAFAALDRIRDDSTMVSNVNAVYSIALQVVNYIEGKNPEIPSNPAELMYWSMYATGLPPIELPVREQASDGSAAWTIRRPLHYVHVSCFFRDLFRVLAHLHDADLIGDAPAGEWEERSYEAPEFSALVFHGGEEFRSTNIQFFDENGSRRIFLPSLSMSENIEEDVQAVLLRLASEHCRSTAEKAIRATEEHSKQAIKQYEALVNERSSEL